MIVTISLKRGGRYLRTVNLQVRDKRAKGLCEECLRLGFVTAGCDVDHIKSKAKGGTDDLENLQLLCKECHKKKTQEEK